MLRASNSNFVALYLNRASELINANSEDSQIKELYQIVKFLYCAIKSELVYAISLRENLHCLLSNLMDIIAFMDSNSSFKYSDIYSELDVLKRYSVILDTLVGKGVYLDDLMFDIFEIKDIFFVALSLYEKLYKKSLSELKIISI